MNCNRFEKLIPLYVEGDLDTDDLHRVAEHVRGCHSCARLANHYQASQAWLHTLTPPELDEAFFSELKQSVMQEIHSRKARPSFFQWFAWQWKPAYAVAVLLLLLFGALAFYVQSNRQSVSPNPGDFAGQGGPTTPQPEPKNAPPENPAPKPEPEKPETLNENLANNTKPQASPRHREKAPKVNPTPVNLAPIVEAQISLRDHDEINAEEMSEFGTFISSAEMTRIEIQTGDPNIRIIWFAPKTVELPKTMTE
jgi:hypothetical protein